jgi:Collagen triple helix repeat (20 copies)
MWLVAILRFTNKVVAIGAGVALAVAGGTAAMGATSSGSTTVSACWNTKSGALHLKTTKIACHKGESLTSWASRGATGPTGKTGATGKTGVAGPTGPTGAQGPAGAKGDPGDPGDAGATGDTGDTGARGEAGPPGEAGPQGLPGEAGPQGEAGSPGDAGPQGLPGEAGPRGEQGLQGEQGATGDPGVLNSSTVVSDPQSVEGGSSGTVLVTCPDFETVLGGGVDSDSLNLNSSHPVSTDGGQGWQAKMTNTSDEAQDFTVYAICAAVSSVSS